MWKEIKSVSCAVSGESLSEMFEALKNYSQGELTTLVINERINDFVREWADFKDDNTDPHGHGKRIPYIGWFWRNVDFAGKEITIGNCGEFIGFMENNKWDSPQRDLTPEEADQVIKIILSAMRLSQQGGFLDKILDDTRAEISKLWDLMQTFEV